MEVSEKKKHYLSLEKSVNNFGEWVREEFIFIAFTWERGILGRKKNIYKYDGVEKQN
jgi:5'(3')-deoxyribonucleotidase